VYSKIQNIEQILSLGGNDKETFNSLFKPISLSKGDLFIKEGQYVNKVGFITKGCMMCVYHKDGKEYIDEFSIENEFITDYFSFLTDTPSSKDVKCLEDCEIFVLQKEDLYSLYEKSHKFERIGRLIAEGLFMNWEQKSKSLVLDTAEERYVKLIKERPSISQRVPQYLIASFLGVTPETVSRIRNKLANK